MGNPRFPIVRINLVEQKGWEDWDTGGRLVERASDAAHEDFGAMSQETLEGLVRDMVGDDLMPKGPKEWSPKKITVSDEEIEWIAERIRKGDNDFETSMFAIMDAMTWMYEIAMTPSDYDIREAMMSTVREPRFKHVLDWDLWAPLVPTYYDNEEVIIYALLRNGVEYKRERDHWDRYIVFDFNGREVVEDLYKKSPLSKKDLKGALAEEFKNVREFFMDHFFYFLKKEFQEVDITNRADWRKQWRAMVASSEMKNVRKEILAAIKNRGAQNG